MKPEGEHQPHVHVLFSERTHDGIERRARPSTFKRYYRAHPERGGCQQDSWFNQRSAIYEIRAAWCDWTNYTMERAGHEARIHPSSLYKRGIDRHPEPKVGPGQDAGAVAERERIRQHATTAQEQAQAQQAWEARKVKLGITNVQQIPPQQFVQSTMHRARHVHPGQWVPGLPSAQAQQRRGWYSSRRNGRRPCSGSRRSYASSSAAGRRSISPAGSDRDRTRYGTGCG